MSRPGCVHRGAIQRDEPCGAPASYEVRSGDPRAGWFPWCHKHLAAQAFGKYNSPRWEVRRWRPGRKNGYHYLTIADIAASIKRVGEAGIPRISTMYLERADE